MAKKRPAFSHDIRRDGNVVIVALRGHLHGAAAVGLKPEVDRLLDEGATSVVFDCRDLTYTGMYGFQIVLAAAKELQRRKGRFGMCNLIPELREIFWLASKTSVNIPIFDSLEAALAAGRIDLN